MSPRLKYWFNIGNFFQTMQPNIRVLKLFGMFPYTISRPKRISVASKPPDHSTLVGCNRLKTLETEIKFMDIVIFTLWQTFFLQMLYASWPKMFLDFPVSRIITTVTLLMYLLGGLNSSASMTLTLVFRNKFIRMVQLVEEADFLFSKFSVQIYHAKHHLICVALLLGSFVCQGLLVLNDFTAGQSFTNTTFTSQDTAMHFVGLYYYTVRCVHISCVITFVGGLYSFRDRFNAINRQLRICFLDCSTAEQITTTNSILYQLQGLTAIYSNLCDAIAIFCTIFVWQPMIFCASVIVTAVFSILTIGHTLTNPAPVVLALAMIYSALTILYTLIFLILVKLGNDLKREGKQTAVLVHKAINQSSKAPALVERLLLFSHHLQHQRPLVSCGLFCFDWTLALSIISALATYSVILIQFELGVPKFFISAILQQNADISTTSP